MDGAELQADQQRRPPSLLSYRSFINLSMKREGTQKQRELGLTMRLSFRVYFRVFTAMLPLPVQSTLSGLLYPVSLNAHTPATVLTHTKCSVIARGVAQLMGDRNLGQEGQGKEGSLCTLPPASSMVVGILRWLLTGTLCFSLTPWHP